MSFVEVSNLTVELVPSGVPVVDDVSFTVDEGEVVALVGESGSGKTTLGVALLGEARRGARIRTGTIRVGGVEVVPAPRKALTAVRGKLVAYIPQDPAAALNPAIRIGTQIEETLIAHGICATRKERAQRIRRVLAEVKLPNDDEFLARFPHQLSGGQQQRVCMAIAISCEPRVLVLDEPTTGLDVSTQAHVLSTLSELVSSHKMAAVYVTHDLAVVANLADHMMVLYAGRIVESGARRAVFAHRAHPYTAGLVAAIPDLKSWQRLQPIPGSAPGPAERPGACAFAPRCRLAIDICRTEEPPPVDVGAGHLSRCFRTRELMSETNSKPSVVGVRASAVSDQSILSVRDVDVSYGPRQVLYGASLDIRDGECVALVGESGSGKTALSRAIAGLIPSRSGQVVLQGEPLAPSVRDYPTSARQALQYIFQSPYNSLNPRRTVGDILETPIRHFFEIKRKERRVRAARALERVALPARVAALYPNQISGGERQRVAIARALVCDPQVLLCDEITSALDVSVQAAIVNLLASLQKEDNLGLLFVTHNIGLVRSIADRVLVMSEGRVIEDGRTDDVLDHPQELYTQALVADTPIVEHAEAMTRSA